MKVARVKVSRSVLAAKLFVVFFNGELYDNQDQCYVILGKKQVASYWLANSIASIIPIA